MGELQKLQEVTAALRQQLDAANLQLKCNCPSPCNAQGCLLRELTSARLQLSAMVEERDLYSDVVDAAEAWLKHHGNGGIAEAEANKALRYQVEQLGEKVTVKPVGEATKQVGLGDFCPKHGGLWSYKCQACVDRVKKPKHESVREVAERLGMSVPDNRCKHGPMEACPKCDLI